MISQIPPEKRFHITIRPSHRSAATQKPCQSILIMAFLPLPSLVPRPRPPHSIFRRPPRASAARHIRVAPTPQGGRGLVAQSPLTPGTTIASVALSTALVVTCDHQSSQHDHYPFQQAGWVSSSYWRSVDWDCKLCALLLYHAQHPDSPWAQYVSTLPQPHQLTTAADLPDDAMMELQYQPLIDAIECHQYRVAACYEKFLAALPVHRRAAIDSHRYEWAMKIVHSRAFSIPPGAFAASSTRAAFRPVRQSSHNWPTTFALVPVLDMLNHGTGQNLAHFRFDEKCQSFQLVAGEQGYDSDAQILVSYGDLSNDELYLLYGFVQAGNPCDVVEVEDVSEWVAGHGSNREWNLYHAKLRLLERASLVYEGRKYNLSRTEIDPDLVAALRILLAQGDDLKRAHAAFKKLAEGDKRAPIEWYRPLSELNERKVWSKIERQCDRLLHEFPTSLELDEEMIILHAASHVPSDISVSTPLLFRAEKKRILKQAGRLAARQRLCVELHSDNHSIKFANPPAPDTREAAQ